MSKRLKRNMWLSALVHMLILSMIIVVPMIMRCQMRREKPHEIITYVDLTVPMPPALPETSAPEMAEPVPTPPPKKDIPEPVPEKKKKKIEVSKKRIRRKDTEPVPPRQPQLSPEEIRKLLDAGAKPSNRPSTQTLDLPGWYYALVRQTMYDAWAQPGGLAAEPGRIARILVRVERDGRITARTLVQSSGEPLIDDSAMQAVNSISRLKPLPASFPGKYKNITIDFELTGTF